MSSVKGWQRTLILTMAASIASAAIALFAEAAARYAIPMNREAGDQFLFWTLGTAPVFFVDKEVARTQEELVVLNNREVVFSVKPAAGTIRIICVGDSTTAGWPYHPRGSYPSWLGAILSDITGRNVEVINAGFHGFDSVRAAQVASEALAYEPRALIFRAGYNDRRFFHVRRLSRIKTLMENLRRTLLHDSRLFGEIVRRIRRGPVPLSVSFDKRESETSIIDALVAANARTVKSVLDAADRSKVPVLLLSMPYDDRRVQGPASALC